MRTLVLLFSLMITTPTFAQEKPEPTPEIKKGSVVQIYASDLNRYKAQVWSLSGSEIVCSATDPKVESDTFELKDKTISVVPAANALHCFSKGGANMGVALTGDQNRSYSNSIQNIGAISVEALPSNPSRIRGVIQSNSSTPIFCGYECPAAPTTGFYLVHPMSMDFRGTNPVCCITSNGAASIVVSSEVQN